MLSCVVEILLLTRDISRVMLRRFIVPARLFQTDRLNNSNEVVSIDLFDLKSAEI